MDKISRPQNSHQPNQHPKNIEQCICPVFLEDGTPRKQEGIDGVEDPHEHERTVGSEPADEAETEDAHDDADHFKDADMFQDKSIVRGHGFPREQDWRSIPVLSAIFSMLARSVSVLHVPLR